MSRGGLRRRALLLLLAISGCRLVSGSEASPSEPVRSVAVVHEAAPEVRVEAQGRSASRDRLAASTLMVQESALHDRLPALRQRALRILLAAREASPSRRLIWEFHQLEGFVPAPGDGWDGLGDALALEELADLSTRLAQVAGGEELAASLAAHATDPACAAASTALLLLPGLSEVAAREAARRILGDGTASEAGRRIAARVLGRLGDADDACRLADILDQGLVGNEAARALRRFARGRRPQLVQALLGGLAAPTPSLRKQSCQLIEALLRDGLLNEGLGSDLQADQASSGGGWSASLAARLRQLVVGEERADVTVAAIRALGLLGAWDPGTVGALNDVLALGGPSARLEAARVLVDGGDAGVVDLLARLSRDEWAAIRAEAVRGLGILGGGRHREVLERALDDPSASVRLAAARALVMVGTPESVPVMLRGLRRGAGLQIKVVLAAGLGGLRDSRATVPLVRLLGDQSAAVRIASARALGRIGGETASESLVYLLDDPVAEVRVAAARGLADTEDSRMVGVLEELLDRPDAGSARISVALALVRLGRPLRAAPVVRSCLESALSSLETGAISQRREAHHVIRAVAGRDFGYDPQAPSAERLTALREIRQWWEWERRRYR